jgi:hypothetical protein
MKEKIEDKIKTELDFILNENGRNLKSLKEQKSNLNEIESSIFRDTKFDLHEISKEMRNLKTLKEESESINMINNLHSIIEQSHNLDEENKIDLERDIQIIKNEVIKCIKLNKINFR